MKTIQKMTARISLIFALLIFCQSCRVYRSTSISLEDAVRTEARVRVKTQEDKTFRYKKIIFQDGQFFGVKDTYSGLEHIPLYPEMLKEIRPQNKGLSIAIGIVGGVLLVYAVGIAIIGISGGFDVAVAGAGFM